VGITAALTYAKFISRLRSVSHTPAPLQLNRKMNLIGT
jgi:hypothetical protein